MVGGFATIAGGVLAAYIGMGVDAGHLVVASVMSAASCTRYRKIATHPETEVSKRPPAMWRADNVVDAAARGATDGLKLALNVAAMLIAFLGLVAVADWILGGLDAWIDGSCSVANKWLTRNSPASFCDLHNDRGTARADRLRHGRAMGRCGRWVTYSAKNSP